MVAHGAAAIPDSELTPGGKSEEERLAGEERKRGAKYKREREIKNGVRLLGSGGQVSGGVWNSTSQVNPREATATGGKEGSAEE